MKQSDSPILKDDHVLSENESAGLTHDLLLFAENIYASLPMSI